MSDAIHDLFDGPSGQTRRLGPGEYLFHKGQKVSSLFMVIAGEVQLIRHQEGGGAIILQRAGPGEIAAEASVFSMRYHCDGIARTDAEIRSIGKQEFLNRFRKDVRFAEAWASRLAREVQNARFRSEVLSLKTVAQRLDAWFEWRGDMPPRGEWVHLAFQIGVSPEALYRELTRRRIKDS
jgi:CRP-like cAMP-binding protein